MMKRERVEIYISNELRVKLDALKTMFGTSDYKDTILRAIDYAFNELVKTRQFAPSIDIVVDIEEINKRWLSRVAVQVNNRLYRPRLKPENNMLIIELEEVKS